MIKEENKKRDEEIRNLQETNRIILFKMEQLKKIHGVNMIEDYNSNIDFKDNNEININNRDKKPEIKGNKNNESKENNEININPIENNIFNFIDNVIDQNNKENNIKEKKFNKAKENMDYLFDFDFHKNKDDF